MKKNLCIGMIMATLMLWGCSREEKQAEAPPPVTMPTVEKAMDTAKEATEMVAKQVEKTTEAVEEKVEQVEQQVAAVQEHVAATAEKLTTTVESVTIDNKNGKVVLPHKKHAEAFGCAVCHGDNKPGPQKLGKETAHALCQGCHKEKKNGPTSCNQCHQKKAKAHEGC